MRHIKDIKELPVSELSDEEILKVACHRLNAKCGFFGYMSQDGTVWLFGRYKNKHPEGRRFLSDLWKAWESKIGKFKRIKEK